MRDLTGLTPEQRAEVIAHEKEQQAKSLLQPVIDAINGGLFAPEDMANFLMNEHATLLGQFAKGTALGVMRRTMRDPDWKAFDKTLGRVSNDPVYVKLTCIERPDLPEHPEHDGRLSCQTVMGAELMAQQSFI